jgi:glycosyltransferase involved in cell wall biosynthesis
MRIAIVAPSPVPFTLGGVEKLALGLQEAFINHTNHSAEIIKLPVDERTLFRTLKGYLSFSRLNLDYFDLVISLKYPAWMIKHKNHVCYMTHRLRGVYDCFNGEVSFSRYLKEIKQPTKLGGIYMRKIIHFLDYRALTNERINHFFCISETVKNRSGYYPKDAKVKVVYPPSPLKGLKSQSGQYLFTVSRLDGPKRINLVIDAFKQVKTDVKLIIAGDGPQKNYLESLAKDDKRIEFIGYQSDKNLIDLYASAIAVVFVPQQEDLGLITLEAMKSKKPVITCSDSGGPLEFVENKKTGLIANPDADSLVQAMQELVRDKNYAKQLGEQAYESVSNITWENTVEQLLSNQKAK